MGKKPESEQPVFDACPHCGQKLSPWEQVLLSIDHALMCRHCWYRIILDAYETEKPEDPNEGPPTLKE